MQQGIELSRQKLLNNNNNNNNTNNNNTVAPPSKLSQYLATNATTEKVIEICQYRYEVTG